LGEKEAADLEQKGSDVILQNARDFRTNRSTPARPSDDGRQTPMQGHPVSIAQHATATCCRSCLSKWHDIEKGKPLDAVDVDYVVAVVRQCLERRDEHAG
jgi:hypothetical protein